MPHYKLYYFDKPTRGRAEFARLILAQAGVQYEDVRFKPSEWPAIKPTTPFGHVPVLEVDGKQLAQSITIARYLAKQYDLAGKNDWEQALADMYADNIHDLMNALVPGFLEKDPAKQIEMYGKVITDVVIPHAITVNNQLELNKTGYLVGDQLTWADLMYYAYFSFVTEKFGDDSLKNAPLLKDLVNRVGDLPNIKKWSETRPKSSS